MHRPHGVDRHPVDLGSVARPELVDNDPGAPDEAPGPTRRDKARRAREAAQRRPVEMVVMQVREEDRVDVRRHLGRLTVAPQVRHPRAKDRVCQKADTSELQQHGGVADVCDASGRYAP